MQTVRDRVLRFNARGAAGLLDGKAPGARALSNDLQRAAVAGIVEAGPVLAGPGVVRWRVADLVAWVQGRFGITLSPQTMSRELRALGYRKLSARCKALGAKGPANRPGLYLWCDLPGAGRGGWPYHAADLAAVQHRGDGRPSGRNLAPCRPWRAGGADPRSGGLACLGGAQRAGHYHPPPPAAKMPRVEPRRKHLAVPARQPALQHHLRNL